MDCTELVSLNHPMKLIFEKEVTFSLASLTYFVN